MLTKLSPYDVSQINHYPSFGSKMKIDLKRWKHGESTGTQLLGLFCLQVL